MCIKDEGKNVILNMRHKLNETSRDFTQPIFNHSIGDVIGDEVAAPCFSCVRLEGRDIIRVMIRGEVAAGGRSGARLGGRDGTEIEELFLTTEIGIINHT